MPKARHDAAVPGPMSTTMNGHAAPPPLRHIGLLLVPAFSMMALSSASEPLRAANRLSGQALYEWHLLSRDGGLVESSSGMAIQTSALGAAPPRLDRLFIVASLGIETMHDAAIHHWLRRLSRQETVLGALSTGSFVLARAGLLDGYRCTLHWEALRQFGEEFPGIVATREVFVRDRDRLTCAGGTAAMDLMLDEIATDHGGLLAADVAEQFLHARIRGPQEQQRMAIQWRYGVNDARVAKAIALMEEHVETVLPIERIAADCGLSLRQLERLWRQLFEATPHRFYAGVRLAEARRLLRDSSDSIASVALRCGFASASHLTTAFHARFGHPPGVERRRRAVDG